MRPGEGLGQVRDAEKRSIEPSRRLRARQAFVVCERLLSAVACPAAAPFGSPTRNCAIAARSHLLWRDWGGCGRDSPWERATAREPRAKARAWWATARTAARQLDQRPSGISVAARTIAR